MSGVSEVIVAIIITATGVIRSIFPPIAINVIHLNGLIATTSLIIQLHGNGKACTVHNTMQCNGAMQEAHGMIFPVVLSTAHG